MKQKVIFVGGPAGAGKSTISRGLQENLENSELYHFFRKVSEQSDVPKLSPVEKLRAWDSLQVRLVKNVIVPKLEQGKTMIFDTHYSLKSSDDAEAIFAKRLLAPEDIYTSNFTTNFLTEIGALRTGISMVLITASDHVLYSRMVGDIAKEGVVHNASIEGIRKELSAEIEFHKRNAEFLRGLKAQVDAFQVENGDGMQKQTLLKILLRVG